MPQVTTKRATFNAAVVGVKVSMDDAIQIMSPDDVPLQLMLGTEPVTNIKNQWLNEELDPQAVTLTEASASADTSITFGNGDATALRVNDVLKAKSTAALPTGTVMLKVLTVDYVSGIVTFTRPFNGSTDQNLAIADILEVVGQDLDEGADPQDPRAIDYTGDYNVSQTYQEQVAATRTGRKNEQYGVSDPFAHETEKKMRELPIRHERTLIHGRRQDPVGNGRRQMGGLLYYLTANLATAASKTTLETTVNDMLQFSYDAGGTPRVLVCSPAIKRLFSGLNAGNVVEERSDTGIGRVKTVYMSDFGNIELAMNRHMPRNKAFLLSPEYIRRQVFDGWFMEMLAKTGDSEKGHIVGEFSLKVKNPKAHGVLTVTDLTP